MNSQREVIYTRRRHALYGERIEIDLNLSLIHISIRVYNYLQHNGSFMGSYDPKRRSDFVRAMRCV